MTHTADIQRRVFLNIAARGYTRDLTPEQFAARQVAKIAEELGEYSECFTQLPPYARVDVEISANTCKENFRTRSLWLDAKLTADKEAVAKELADIIIPALSAGEALGIDVLQMALDKSAADVARGVR